MAKPVVDRIEHELAGEAAVVRLDVLSSTGREAASRYGIRGLPTLVVLDGCGEVVAVHAGAPNANTVLEIVRAVPICTPSSDSVN